MNIALLNRLRAAEGAFVALSELGPELSSVRTGLEELEAFGFVLERHPYRGVAYRGPAKRLCPDQIEYELGTGRVGRRIAVWNRVASTNDLAARGASSAANEGLVVLAEEQTAGRGRRGRQWAAPPRSAVLMSVLLFPPEHLAEAGWLTALGAVAAAEVVAEWTGLDARIKWPNDVRVGGRKVAGVLVERSGGAIIGIGLNANTTSDDLGDELKATATSIQILRGEPVDRSELVRALIRRLDAWYSRGWSVGPETLNAPWRGRSEHLGQWIAVETPGRRLVGRLNDLDLQHGAEVALAEGPTCRIPAREILSLAPA